MLGAADFKTIRILEPNFSKLKKNILIESGQLHSSYSNLIR